MCRCWLLYKLLFLSFGKMKSRVFGSDVIKKGALCLYFIHTGSVYRITLVRFAGFSAYYFIADFGQCGQCIINIFQKAKTQLMVGKMSGIWTLGKETE